MNRRNSSLFSVLRNGPLPASALRAMLGGVSAATLSRLARESGESVIRFGRARATAYAGIRTISGVNRRFFPVTEIDEAGGRRDFGRLIPVHGGFLHLTDSGTGTVHDGLPWWMADLAPQGFLGRAFALRNGPGDASLPPLPPNPGDWSDDLRLAVIASSRWAPPGNLIIGESTPREDSGDARSEADFLALAARAMAGDVPGSSAAGEQPKFCCRVEGFGPALTEALVKFSWGESEVSRRRRADLLVCEHLATELFTPGASRLLQAGDVTFLISKRWDYTAHGRRGIVSLGALDDEFVGARRSWTHSAAALADIGVITREDSAQVRRRECFARMIGNNDRHAGNISFYRSGLMITGLAPVYDMLPMRYAPSKEGPPFGEILSKAEMLEGGDPNALRDMAPLAIRFWETAGRHDGISPGFRAIALGNAAALAASV